MQGPTRVLELRLPLLLFVFMTNYMYIRDIYISEGVYTTMLRLLLLDGGGWDDIFLSIHFAFSTISMYVAKKFFKEDKREKNACHADSLS